MRIVHITAVYEGHGGVQRQVRGLASALTEAGHDVTVLVGGTGTDFDAPVVVRHFPTERRLMSRYAYSSALLRATHQVMRTADVVHVHQPRSLVAIRVGFGRSARTVLSPYHHDSPAAGWWDRRVLRAVVRGFDGLAFVSDAERASLEQITGPLVGDVIYPGVDHASDPGIERSGGVVSIGRAVAHKRAELLLVAAAIEPVLPCAVIGSGPLVEQLRYQAANLGLPATTVRDEVDDAIVQEALQKAQVAVALSTEESFGIFLQEAVALGCACVATDLPSHREIASMGAADQVQFVPVATSAEDVRAAIDRALRLPRFKPVATMLGWHDAGGRLERLYQHLLTAD